MTGSNFKTPVGINYHCSRDVPIKVLSQALRRVCSFLQNLHHQTQLRRYEDWWEHDGLHFDRGVVDMHGLFALVESPRALFAAMQGDDLVFVGIAPSDRIWYLRFYVNWDDDGCELLGRFEITLPASAASRFEGAVLPDIDITILHQDPEMFYRSVHP